MANADLIAPAAMCNTCANTDTHPSPPMQMIMALDAAIALERQLLRCDGRAAQTDHHIRKAEAQWRQVADSATALQRDYSKGSVTHRSAQIVRNAVLCRDSVNAPRVLTRAMSDLAGLAARSRSAKTAEALHDAVGLLGQMRQIEQADVSPCGSGARPDSPDLGLEI